MKTPEEKAKELISNMAMHQVWHSSDSNVKGMQDRAKQCALIAISEVLDATGGVGKNKYWQQVKTAITNP